MEALDQRTETAQAFVNPNGTVTVRQSLLPTRVRRDGGWQPVDTTLVGRPDGTIRPAAAAVDLAFSGGGDATLARVRHDGKELGLLWPRPLPKPALNGDTAVYAEVLPGVDLRVTATVLGFSEVLVVKTAAAAANPQLTKVRFRLAATGLVPAQGAGGTLELRDAAGRLTFSAPTPLMWDTPSAAAAGSSANGRGSRLPDEEPAVAPRSPVTRTMPLELTGDELAVVPDPVLLRGPADRFPLYIDPAVTTHKADNGWTTVWSKFAGSSFWQDENTSSDTAVYGAAKVGRVRDCAGCPEYVVRTFFRMDTAPVAGKRILDAKFQLLQKHSWYCDRNTRAGSRKAGLWLTGPISSATTWNNQPAWSEYLGSTDAAHAAGGANGCAGPGQVEFNVTGAVQRAAVSGWRDLTLGMQALNESDVNYWKRYASNPTLSITYNSYPNMPDQLSTDGKACRTGGSRPYVTTATPQLRARATDPDTDQQALRQTFYWWRAGGARNETDKVVLSPLANPGPGAATVPAGRLVDGETYAWQSVVHDPHGDQSQFSPVCEFTVDTTRPAPPAGVTSTDYPADNQFHGEVGRAGTFRLLPPATGAQDVDAYVCAIGLNPVPEAGTVVPASGVDRGAEVSLTPGIDGNVTLRVWTRDRAGNLSNPAAPYEHRILVRAGSAPAARWSLDEGAGQSSTDAAAHGNTLTLTGASGWTTGRGGTGSALNFSSPAYATATAPLMTRDPATGTLVPLRTDANFTVTAWVRLASAGGGEHVVVSQDGARRSAYALGYSGRENRWFFAMAGADTDSAPVSRLLSDAGPIPGVWTHLAATFDTSGRTLRLFVNGSPQSATATLAGGFDGTTGVSVGRGKAGGQHGSPFAGAVDDIQVYPRAVAASELPAMVRPVRPTVDLPSGPMIVGRAATVTVSAGGDANVTMFRYSLGNAGLDVTAMPDIPGGTAYISVTPTEAGEIVLAVASVDGAGRRSEVAGQYVQVLPPPALTGTVRDAATGQPLAGATVALRPSDTTVTTSADGSFRIDGMSPLRYTISARSGERCDGLFAITQVDVYGPVHLGLYASPYADAYGYTCAVSDQPLVPADGTALSFPGRRLKMALPFPVSFYGHTHEHVWVDKHGALMFAEPGAGVDAQGFTEHPGGPLAESPGNLITPYWAEFMYLPNPSSQVITTVRGTAPRRSLVVEWRDVAVRPARLGRVTFQAILGEDRSITFAYAGLDNASEQGRYATAGIAAPGARTSLQYSYAESVLRNGRAITFRHPDPPQPLPTGALTGRVLDAQTSAPVAGARVALRSGGRSTISGPDGSYVLPTVDAGRYTVEVSVRRGCRWTTEAEATIAGDTALDLSVNTGADSGYTCSVDAQPFIPADQHVIDGADVGATVDLPFPVRAFGTEFRTLEITPTQAVLFNPRNELAAVLLEPFLYATIGNDGSVRTATIGSGNNRRFVVEWRNARPAGSPNGRFSFQLVLGEDGTISYNYAGLDDDLERGAYARVRLAGTGQAGGGEFVYADHEPILANGQAITFRPVTP